MLASAVKRNRRPRQVPAMMRSTRELAPRPAAAARLGFALGARAKGYFLRA
jgi:hypothetical protein